MGIGIGDRAPRFALSDSDGKTIELEALLEKGPLVIFFYPRDETPGCTKEACSFRDNYAVFEELGAQVVGISSDSSSSHRRFSDKFRFPFPLLSDEGGKTRKAFGVPKTLGILDGRSTYVIDTKGVVRGVFHSQLQVTKHVDEAAAAVRALG
jgi:thioredoxin-dependent peroxiredoxin